PSRSSASTCWATRCGTSWIRVYAAEGVGRSTESPGRRCPGAATFRRLARHAAVEPELRARRGRPRAAATAALVALVDVRCRAAGEQAHEAHFHRESRSHTVPRTQDTCRRESPSAGGLSAAAGGTSNPDRAETGWFSSVLRTRSVRAAVS